MVFLLAFFYSTPFHYAIESDDLEIVDYLIKDKKLDKKLLSFNDLQRWIVSDKMAFLLIQYLHSKDE